MGHGDRSSLRRHRHGGRSRGSSAGRDDASPLLLLQRLAGNRAVAGMLGGQPVQRACCGGCAAGGSCEESTVDEARPVQATVQRYDTEDCGPYNVQQRVSGVAIAKAESRRAVTALQRYVNAKRGAHDPATTKLLQENFASSSSSTAYEALVRFTKIWRYLERDDYTIECENDCKSEKAYVYGLLTDIHMCMNNLANESPLRYGEILLHEVSHDAAGTDDEQYYYPSRTTTTLSVSDALDNADSYESFAAQI